MTEQAGDAGIRSAAGMGADLPPPTPVSRDSTAGVAVMAHLRRQTAVLLTATARIPTEGPDAVHDTRVACRRLRSGLRLYGDLLAGDVATPLRRELGWYAGALGDARDLDVFAAHLEASDDRALADAMVAWVRRRQAEAIGRAAEQLASPRATALREALAELARAPRFTGTAARRAGKVLAPRVLHADRKAHQELGRLAPDDAPELWHHARIVAKRARYAAEVGAPALGRPCADLAVLWSRLTEPLGQSQDAVIQRGLVQARVDDPQVPLTAAEAFACGLFVAGSHDREIDLHVRAHAVWADLRPEHRRLRKAVSG